jgi:hypothetical protein
MWVVVVRKREWLIGVADMHWPIHSTSRVADIGCCLAQVYARVLEILASKLELKAMVVPARGSSCGGAGKFDDKEVLSERKYTGNFWEGDKSK